MSKIDAFVSQIGIRIVPYKVRCGRWETQARQVLRKIHSERGEGHLSMVLKCIKARNENGLELWSETILAVSDVLSGFLTLEDRGLALLDQFEAIDMRTMRLRAKQIAIAEVTARQALAILLAEALAPDLPEIPPARPAEGLQVKRRKRVLAERREAMAA